MFSSLSHFSSASPSEVWTDGTSFAKGQEALERDFKIYYEKLVLSGGSGKNISLGRSGIGLSALE